MFLAPYIDLATTYTGAQVGNLNLTQAISNATTLPILQQPATVFRCPSDVGPQLNSVVNFSTSNNTTVNLPTSNYVANNGSYSFRNALGNPTSSTNYNNGFFGGNSGPGATSPPVGPGIRRMRDITDGTTNVIAIGERCWEMKGVDYRAACLWGQRGSGEANSGEDRDMVNQFAVGWRPMNPPHEPGTALTHRRAFSSLHVGGVQFLLGDGSVRFISENIAHNFGTNQVNSTFAYLLGVDDGNTVGEF
jgi:hypothetical protein